MTIITFKALLISVRKNNELFNSLQTTELAHPCMMEGLDSYQTRSYRYQTTQQRVVTVSTVTQYRPQQLVVNANHQVHITAICNGFFEDL